MAEKGEENSGKGNARSVKNRLRLNFTIDVLMMIFMMAIGGIGLLMKYVLVPGSERFARYGADVDLFLWGWDRHQWGALHLFLGYILLALLVLHIVFHWTQIKCMFRNWVGSRSVRVLLTVVFVPLCLVLFLFAFFVNFEKVPLRGGEGGHRLMHERHEPVPSAVETVRSKTDLQETAGEAGHDEDHAASHNERGEHESRSVVVYGSMTLSQLEKQYGVPADSIKKHLGIPLSASDHENLGRLRKAYGFYMSDVERFIEKYR